MSKQAINEYLDYHSELSRPRDARKIPGTQELERYNKIKLHVIEGLTRKEIADKLGLSYGGLDSYLYRHPELPKPKKVFSNFNVERYNQIKQMLEEGFSQFRIAKLLGNKPTSMVNSYLKSHPELRQIYDNHRRNKK